MAILKFAEDPGTYQIAMKFAGDSLIQLYPPFPETDITAGFYVLTKEKGGKVFGDYTAYTTIYRKMADGSIILSNDGSVWVEPVYKVRFMAENASLIGVSEQTPENYENLLIPEVEPEENYEFIGWNPEIPEKGKITHDMTFVARTQYIPTLEEVKVTKKREISVACEQIIHDGVDVEIDGRIEHFSLSTNDQLNLFGKQYQLASGMEQVEYHEDGCPCRYYPATDMLKIITAAMEWVSYHTTICNSINMWIAGATTKEEVAKIYYGAEIPEEYQSEVLKEYIALAAGAKYES